MSPDPKFVLQLAERIVQTEALLNDLRQQWERLFVDSTGTSANAVIVRPKRDGSFASKVEAIIAAQPQKSFTIAEIAEITHEDTLKTGRALFSLASRNHIESRGRGLYGAKSLPHASGEAA
jgi:hypothetical protein